MTGSRKALMSVLLIAGMFSVESCLFNPHAKISGRVEYLVSSEVFKIADSIEYRDADQTMKTVTNISLPWEYSYEIINAETYDMYIPWFRVIIQPANNASGGGLQTKCTFSMNFGNDDYEKYYVANQKVEQTAGALIFPNTF